MKKFLYFLLFLLLLSLGFFLYWYLSQKGYVPPIKNFPANPFGLFQNGTKNPQPVVTNPANGGNNTGNGSTTVILLQEDKLFEKIWADPVAGYSFSEYVTYENTTVSNKNTEVTSQKSIASSTAILFVDRATGHIYKKNVFSNIPATKISNTTIPGVYDAYFFKNNTEVLIRYLRESDNTIMTLFAKLPPLSANVVLPLKDVKIFPQNIVSVGVSPDQSEVSYLEKTSSGSTLYTFSNDIQKKIHDYDLSELTLTYKGKDIIVSQKPSAFEKTYFFTSDESLVYGGKTGEKVLFSKKNPNIYLSSFWSDKGLRVFSDSLTTSKVNVFTVQTLADKCVSSVIGNYFFCAVPRVIPIIPFGMPDDWYKGTVSFNDSLYILDTVYYKENEISALEKDTGEEMDMMKPVVSIGDTYMAFSNKNNSSLWVARLSRLLTR